MFSVCVFTILTELAMTTRILIKLAFNSFVVAIRELKIKLLLKIHLFNIMLRKRSFFAAKLMFTMCKMAARTP